MCCARVRRAPRSRHRSMIHLARWHHSRARRSVMVAPSEAPSLLRSYADKRERQRYRSLALCMTQLKEIEGLSPSIEDDISRRVNSSGVCLLVGHTKQTETLLTPHATCSGQCSVGSSLDYAGTPMHTEQTHAGTEQRANKQMSLAHTRSTRASVCVSALRFFDFIAVSRVSLTRRSSATLDSSNALHAALLSISLLRVHLSNTLACQSLFFRRKLLYQRVAGDGGWNCCSDER